VLHILHQSSISSVSRGVFRRSFPQILVGARGYPCRVCLRCRIGNRAALLASGIEGWDILLSMGTVPVILLAAFGPFLGVKVLSLFVLKCEKKGHRSFEPIFHDPFTAHRLSLRWECGDGCRMPVCQGTVGMTSSGASSVRSALAALSWGCFLRKKLCMVSDRFFKTCQRSAICLALGAPTFAHARIIASTIAADDFHSGMRREPRGLWFRLLDQATDQPGSAFPDQ
jgi:hypothetical protein